MKETQQTQKETIIFGKAHFSNDVPPEVLQHLQDEQLSGHIKSVTWNLGFVNIRQKYHDIFKFMKSAKCLRLSFHNNQTPSILTYISQTTFTYIKILGLGYNKIVSIESLPFINMQTLCHLELSNNQIINIKPLNKCKWKSFRVLNLQDNPLKQIELSRLQYQKLNPSLRIGLINNKYKSNFFFGISKMVKFQISIIYIQWIDYKPLLNSSRVIDTMEQRLTLRLEQYVRAPFPLHKII